MNIDNIKVTVITPTYNDEKFIGQTIESILNQTHKNLEIIVVDDCSTDQTATIVKSFNDPRIHFFQNEKNYGASFSRDFAIKKSTGDYIAFLDGDDVWKPNKISAQLIFMMSNKYDFTATYYDLIDENGAPINRVICGPNKVTHKQFLKMNYCGCLTVMYRREIIPNLSIPKEIRKRNDYALWLKISEITPCYFLNDVLADYRIRKNSISSGSKLKLLSFHVEMFERLYSFRRAKAIVYALRNAFYYSFIKRKYVKKNEL